MNGTAVAGNSDVVCAIPGQAVLAGSGSSGTIAQNVHAVERVLAGLRPPQGTNAADLRTPAATIASIVTSATSRLGDDKR